MAVLKFKDLMGVWHSIPAIQGEQGIQGPKGDTGDPGEVSQAQMESAISAAVDPVTAQLADVVSEIGTKETVLLKTFRSSDPPTSMGQSGFRGMVTRIVNPGKFTKIRATVFYKSMTVNRADAPYGVIHVGVMSGNEVIEELAYADAQTYLATGEAALTETDRCVTLDLTLNAAVDSEDETLYVWLWNTDGSGKWMNANINKSAVANDNAHPNYYLGRYGSSSSKCYTTFVSDASGKAAAFQIVALQNPTDIALSALDARLDALEAAGTETENPLDVLRPDGGYCGIFNTIACIGDSLTAGVHEHNETGEKEYPQCPNYSYPTYMQRALGNTVYKYARGGATVKSTLSAIVSDAWLPDHHADLYIIALGTNGNTYPDPMSGATTDIDTTDMTLTDTTTDIGAYGKLIQLIREQVPKSKIFLVTVPYTRNTETQVSQTAVKIRALAELMGCYVIDLEKYGVPYADKWTWRAIYYLGGHLSTIGYKYLSIWFMSYIDWIIRRNMDDFAQTAFIQTTHEYITEQQIVVFAQPADRSVTVGAITGGLSVAASMTQGGTIAYQWYENASDSTTGGTAIAGATSAEMPLDTALAAGTYYYYCVLSGEGATSVTTDCATVTVAASDGAYLAKYTLNGTPSAAAPATITDESGNGNTLTVNGVTAYDATGYLTCDTNNDSISMSTVNLNGKTKYKIHFEFGKQSGVAQNRLFALGGTDVSLQLNDLKFRIETSLSLGFTSPLDTTNYKSHIGGRVNVYKMTVDWIVDGDTVTMTGTLFASAELTPYTDTVTFTCTGFTQALATGGIIIGNRPDGARPAYAPLHEFYIVEQA